MKIFNLIIAVLILSTIILGCENKNSPETTATEDQTPAYVPTELPNTESTNAGQSVVEYLSEEGFMITSDGRTIYREDQLADASLDKITSSIAELEKDKEANQQTIFYLTVAGSALDDDASSDRFIRQNLKDKKYLEDLDKMVKFTQRQDRPMIKKAILNIVSVMSTSQCAEYLKYIGYAKGTTIGNMTFYSNVLKGVPLFLKLVILNKLKSSQEDQETLIYVNMKQDMGVKG